GSAVFDGGTYDWLTSYATQDYSVKTLTNDASIIKGKIPSDVPSDRSRPSWWPFATYSSHGGTFTQHGLRVAAEILDGSTADNKIIVTITDGEPTYSFRGIIDNDNVRGTGGSTNQSIVNETLAEANHLKNELDSLYSLGIEVVGNYADQVIEGLASSSENAVDVGDDDVEDLEDSLTEILTKIEETVNKTIVKGQVEDPIGEMFNLKNEDTFT